MRTEYKYINFVKIGDTGKTSTWAIQNNRSNSSLGEIKWYSAWREYCFFTTSGVVFNKSCMLDILDFIKQLQETRTKKCDYFVPGCVGKNMPICKERKDSKHYLAT
jgi:hypothetical protein